MSILDLERQLCHSVYSCSNALVRAYRPLLETLDLTYPQYIVMLSLWEKDNVNIRHLCGHTRFDSGSLTPILGRLEQKGLLERRPGTRDERQRIVCLTQEGRDLRHRAETVPASMIGRYPFDRDKAVQLKALCEELYAILREGPTDSG